MIKSHKKKRSHAGFYEPPEVAIRKTALKAFEKEKLTSTLALELKHPQVFLAILLLWEHYSALWVYKDV